MTDAAEIKFGRRVIGILRKYSKDIFDLDLDKASADRNNELWLLGIDVRQKKFLDLLGNVDPAAMVELNKPGRFHDTDAGCRRSVHEEFPLAGKRADIFLINMDHVKKSDEFLDGLLIHELCHYVEQSGIPSTIEFIPSDEFNAKVILDGLEARVRSVHSAAWAELLAWAARRGVADGFESVRNFIENAIPPYDRPRWNPMQIQEPRKYGS